MKFPYFKLPHKESHKKSIQVPWIPVAINVNDLSYKFLMLVDSGADMCIFDCQIAELFGIDYKKGDLEMAQEAYSQGFTTKFVFVGNPQRIENQHREFPIRITSSQFELGTLEFLQST